MDGSREEVRGVNGGWWRLACNSRYVGGVSLGRCCM